MIEIDCDFNRVDPQGRLVLRGWWPLIDILALPDPPRKGDRVLLYAEDIEMEGLLDFEGGDWRAFPDEGTGRNPLFEGTRRSQESIRRHQITADEIRRLHEVEFGSGAPDYRVPFDRALFDPVAAAGIRLVTCGDTPDIGREAEREAWESYKIALRRYLTLLAHSSMAAQK